MIAVYYNHDRRYPIESMGLLFFPGEKFKFHDICKLDNLAKVDDAEKNNDNFYIISRLENENNTNTVKARIYFIHNANLTHEHTECCIPSGDAIEKKRIIDSAIKKALYICAVNDGLKKPPFGMLTGIRPAKRAGQLLKKMNRNEAINYLTEKYDLNYEKSKLCIDTAETQIDILSKTKLTTRPFSLYISIPFCPSRCKYCSFVSHAIERAGKLIDNYVDLLIDELTATAEAAALSNLNLQSVYMGGGTPTVLSATQLRRIMTTVNSSFNINSNKYIEFTVEAGRPDSITAEKLQAIKNCGGNRISINPQTLNQTALESCGRKHTVEDFFEKLKLVKNTGFNVINSDLIAGLENESSQSFEYGVEKLAQLGLDNITVHTLCVKTAADLTSFTDEQRQSVGGMIAYANKHLTNLGYRPYYMYRQKNAAGNHENIGYSIPGKESLYNIATMEEIHSILSVGAGGVTKLVSNDASCIDRIFNLKYPYEYIDRIDDMLANKDKIIKFYKERF